MIKEIRYKGHIIKLSDLQIFWVDYVGELECGTIEDYGQSKYREGVCDTTESGF